MYNNFSVNKYIQHIFLREVFFTYFPVCEGEKYSVGERKRENASVCVLITFCYGMLSIVRTRLRYVVRALTHAPL